MQDPSVRMIGHLTARIIGRRSPVAFDLSTVFESARVTGTAIELTPVREVDDKDPKRAAELANAYADELMKLLRSVILFDTVEECM